ncbi:hypothetical protein KAX02_13165 [candidate division WOR-3 bacterium]|nr:hypothetical protein [candidate division WOR-3 bacterium]
MAYESYDPRDDIYPQIGTLRHINSTDGDKYCLGISVEWNDTKYIPMYDSEDVKTESLPEMPFIEVHLADVHYRERDGGAEVREMHAYMDFTIYFTNVDNINPKQFKKKILDEIQNKGRTNQANIPNTYFLSIGGEQHWKEDDGRQVVFQCVVTVHAWKTDAC